MNIPPELRYTAEHEWVRLETDSEGQTIGVMGITDFAQSELGDIVYVEVDSTGEDLQAGEVFGTVEAVKTTSDLFMPLDGRVLEFNDALSETGGDNPALINDDPYGEGWIIKIVVRDLSKVDELLSAEAYSELVG